MWLLGFNDRSSFGMRVFIGDPNKFIGFLWILNVINSYVGLVAACPAALFSLKSIIYVFMVGRKV